ncbi:toxin-antitoxin system YwqK family antitoxin [Flavobacterium sp. UBA7682]|uniref:toxin-antitoxin system YwqK family antitoxin n=1 Tax=Flavobacterium sp. UBA7682 TaxID=1946560 RepID=UPI0025C03A63|nr:hypothetical protein [Flavobacterium sp. UBA7682]
MKTKGFNWFLGSLIVLSLFSFQEPKLKKRITDKEFRYEFYVTDAAPEIKSERIYYWFKAGAIHNSEYGIAGELLDDTFEKFYLNNQLAEKGSFNRGLRVGVWKTWYSNGVMKTNEYWDEGKKKGMSFLYSEQGLLIEKGRFRSNRKHGKWINYISKDTTLYNYGEKVVPKPKKVKEKKTDEEEKPSFFKRIFTKKDKSKSESKTNSKTNLKGDKSKSGKEVKSSQKKVESGDKKDGFFKRLFSKKKKPNDKGQ